MVSSVQMRRDLINIGAFLLGIVLAGLCEFSYAGVAITPAVAGYAGGTYRAVASAFTMTAANDGFIAPAVANVGGRAVTMPATLRMAANAGQLALTGMRLTPLGIAGTLAAGWLLNEGFEYINGQWMRNTGSVPIGGWSLCVVGYGCNVTGTDKDAMCREWGGVLVGYWSATDQCYRTDTGAIYTQTSFQANGALHPNYVPATESDWAALPSPLPAVAPELPYAPYMPEGVPVFDPVYQPQDVPLGDPYKMPDGSTVQDRAVITPSTGGQVTVVQYNQTIIDAQGIPVSNPTNNVQPDQRPDFCQAHPNTVACLDAGQPEVWTDPSAGVAPADPTIGQANNGKAIDWHQAFLPESSATCGIVDASVSVMGNTIALPFSSVCSYLPAIRFVVIALATIVAIRLFVLAPW